MKFYSFARTVIFALLVSASSSAFAATASPAHVALTKAIEGSIEWSGHINKEVAKGKKLDLTHLREEIANLKIWLTEMMKAHTELSEKRPYETGEGHFIAVKKHQTAATELMKNIEVAIEKKELDYSQIKKWAKRMTAELEGAAREHRSELHEIEAL